MLATPAHLQREPTPTPVGAEAGRSFYQSRIQLFFALTTGITLSFFVLHNTLEVLSGHLPLGLVFSLPLNLWHLTAGLLSAAIALFVRARRLEIGTLQAIELVGTVAVLTTHYMMASTLLGVNAPHFDLVLTLLYMLLQMTRAVIIPSTPARTVVACVAAAIPLLAFGYLLAARAPDAWSAARAVYAPLYVALWCLECAVPAALASKVIYGLRQDVNKAKQLGQYTLEDRIGEGGMGTVYRARHALLRRPTAIKLLRPERTGEQALMRFEREVQLTSRLTHPNTVAIYDYGRTADGIFYYAMEYLDGLDLQRLVAADGPQDPGRVVHILTQVCRALSEAHGLGLIHRDVKPANIILCERGGVPDVAKVVDFGLVKSNLAGEQSAHLSAAQVILGTPHFLAPEAIRSADRVDARSDVYALGGVGYYLLTGRQVFDGESVMEICGQHLHTTPVRPSERLGQPLPAAIEAVVLRALEKDPNARPQSAKAMASELEACGVAAWTEGRANSWWAEHRRLHPDGTQAAEAGAMDLSDLQQSPTLLEVDIRGRARSS